jgi:hypothetical protein
MNNQEPRPLRTCDIVMKGGITSGVVYPKAILTLARRFIFKNVGGTSAGAIAAAATAAAECRRIQTGSDAGFEMIGRLGDDLAEKATPESKTRLFSLFQPNAGTQRLFQVMTSAMDGGDSPILTVLVKAAEHYTVTTLLGAVPGFTLAVFSFLRLEAGAIAWVWGISGLLLALVGAVLAAAASLLAEFTREIPQNNFGFCTGMPEEDDLGQQTAQPLTTWLTEYLNQVAGFDPGHRPLIFADLWNPRSDPNHPSDVREVNLEMMTTNLTHGRPYRLPFRYDDDLKENHLFYFREDEFRRLFPASVVDWMLAHPRPIEDSGKQLVERQRQREARAKDGYFPMPAPENLPVVVVVRMSLSFPILLCAIPLHAIDRGKPKEHQKLERCWFSDGGLCSNFPLHFFDGPLPRRPTFSIDLTQKPDDTPEQELLPEMDKSNGGFQPMDRWNRFDHAVFADPAKAPEEKSGLGKLTGFLWTLIDTMQNWNDAMQSRLPGFRDRIVRIPLTSKQGGLNLNMPPPLVKFLADQGEKSAIELMQHFDVPAVDRRMTWENHRQIRLRSTLSSFEKMVKKILAAWDHPENGDPSITDLLTRPGDESADAAEKLFASFTSKQAKAAIDTLTKLREIEALWQAAGTATAGAPKPHPELRPRAQV